MVAIASAIPDSVISQAQNNPVSFADSFASASAPAWVSAIPTFVVGSLETILAKPIKAGDDLGSIAVAPQASSVFANTAIPTSVKAAFTSDPAEFIADVLSGDTWPTWVSSLPAPLQSQVGSVVNQGLSIIAADYEATAGASIPTRSTYSGSMAPTSAKGILPSGSGQACLACPSCSPVTVVLTVTANSKPIVASGIPKGTASSSIKGFTGNKPTGSPIAFTGAAAPMRTAAVGAAVMVAGAGALLNM